MGFYKKILLLGKDGQVGWELQRALAPLGLLTALNRHECDLADPAQVQSALERHEPEVIVNAAPDGHNLVLVVAAHLINKFYRERGRKFTGSHPRDLIEQVIDRARFRRELPELSIEAIEAAEEPLLLPAWLAPAGSFALRVKGTTQT